MGEVADMMINGLLDSQTGEYIDGEEPGFPRTLHDVQLKHKKSQMNGVKNYLRTKHKWLSCRKRHPFCLRYLKEIGKFNPKTDQVLSWKEVDKKIQPEFERFRNYAIKKKLKNKERQ